ncbi:hypothetical protein HMPREF2625_03265 [Rothia sp. HMSC064D08]|nr:hypothetical protein HMPREF2625_03265 [Rothia sp. HMSC064D08]
MFCLELMYLDGGSARADNLRQDVGLLIGSPGLQIICRFERPSAERRSQPDIANVHSGKAIM